MSTNPLDRIVDGRDLPEGCDTWGIKSVHPDLTGADLTYANLTDAVGLTETNTRRGTTNEHEPA